MSVFFDTNILLYADDADAGGKTGIANARKKLHIEGAAARARVEVYLGFDAVTITPALVLAAVDLNRLHTVSFWDALVIR